MKELPAMSEPQGVPPMTVATPLPAAPPPGPAAGPAPRAAGGRGRSFLVGILFLLTCLAVVASSVIVWTHQTVLVTDRYVALVSSVSSDPAVIDAVSVRLADEVMEAIDVEGRLQALLPDVLDPVAATLAARIREGLEERLRTTLASPGFQDAWLAANRFTHEQILAILRGESSFAEIEDGVLSIDLLPLASVALIALQEQGILPADLAIPELTDPAQRDAFVASLEERLGRDLPEDFAMVPVVESESLTTAQTAVRAFDLIAIGSVVVAIVLAVLTVLLARRRLRMVGLLAVGGAVSFAVGLAVIGLVQPAVVDTIVAGQGLVVVDRIVTDLVADLRWWMTVLAAVGIVVAIAAYLLGRPRWLTTGASAARSGDQGAVVAWFRANRIGLALAALVAGGTWVMWNALGPAGGIIGGVALIAIARAVLPDAPAEAGSPAGSDGGGTAPA
jgi:hypothetical protein